MENTLEFKCRIYQPKRQAIRYVRDVFDNKKALSAWKKEVKNSRFKVELFTDYRDRMGNDIYINDIVLTQDGQKLRVESLKKFKALMEDKGSDYVVVLGNTHLGEEVFEDSI